MRAERIVTPSTSHVSEIDEVLTRFGIKRPPKPSLVADSDARKETNAGFRPKKTSDKPAPAKKSKSKGSGESQLVRVEGVHIISYGLDAEGELLVSKSLTGAQIEQLFKYKLAVANTREGDPLEFNVKWSQGEVDEKEQRDIFVMQRNPITGAELNRAKGAQSRPHTEHFIRIGTKHRIPSAQYKDLEHAIGMLQAGEELFSGSEAEETDVSRPRRKSKAKSVKTPLFVEVETSEDDSSDDNSVLEASDTPQTRSSVRVKKEAADHDFLGVAYESEIEEIFPPAHEAFGRGVSLKRSASPSALLDDTCGKVKKIRSGSVGSHISVDTTTDGTGHNSPSPQLRPATSSFQYDPALDNSAPALTPASAYSTWTPSWTITNSVTSSSSAASGSGSHGPSAPGSTAFAAGPSVASTVTSTSDVSPSRRRSTLLSRPTLRNYVPRPPREGLTVPKAADNPWD
ncbi:hypothetical protein B0H15DRAFT_954817 [Mycena belliarum]|uniref:Uncharacterized protein n=1 Tax=Mycena belliarum TaxID=1033014 RepID=A0AAD6XLA5_9AGAR|nr:hypothetical protein B0H15DRAFT_954817 [Mycena belliae]